MNVEFESQDPLVQYCLQLADNVLILGQRLGEWCGHGPTLEQDIALTNFALDFVGQSRLYYQYAAELLGEPHSEDSLAFLRDLPAYNNIQLVEQPNRDFAHTIIRQFLFDSWHYYFLEQLQYSGDERLSAIAAKSIKEVAYHLRFSSEWTIRLGDGTEESHKKMQAALNRLWVFSQESLKPADYELELIAKGIAVDLTQISTKVAQKRKDVFEEATLKMPELIPFFGNGKKGLHTEHLGYILTELQFMQRAYPGLQW